MKVSGAEGEDSGKHEYFLMALEFLLERADAYGAANEAVRWGWCRSAIFVHQGCYQGCLLPYLDATCRA